MTTTTDALAADGAVSLRGASAAANTDAPAFDAPPGLACDTIVFDASLTSGGPAVFTLTLGQLGLFNDVMIQGPGRDLLAMSADNSGRSFFTIGTSTTLSGLTIHDSRLAGLSGAGIFAEDSAITLDGCRVTSNSTDQAGGGIYLFTGQRVLRDSEVLANTADLQGGGIHAFCTVAAEIDRSMIGGNVSGEEGGGIHTGTDCSLLMSDSTVSANTAAHLGGSPSNGYGGSIHTAASSAFTTLIRCHITANRCVSGGGGGMWLQNGGDVEKCTISSNTASFCGGALVNGFGPVGLSPLFRNCTFNGNASPGSGRAFGVGLTTATLENCTITGNIADSDNNGLRLGAIQLGSGGGLFMTGARPLIMENCTITGNAYDPGGGDIGDGGGAYTFGSTVYFANTIIAANSDGGGERPDISAAFVSKGYNLVGNVGNEGFGSNAAGDRYGDPNGTTMPNPGAFGSPTPINPLLVPLQFNGGFTPNHEPEAFCLAVSSANPATTATTDQRGAPRPFDASYAMGGVKRTTVDAFSCENFSSDLLTTAGSATGWSSFGFDSALAFAHSLTTEAALRLYVRPSANRFRIAGVVSNLAGWVPYSVIGPHNAMRGRFYVFALGQSNPADLNQIPNLRLRLSNPVCGELDAGGVPPRPERRRRGPAVAIGRVAPIPACHQPVALPRGFGLGGCSLLGGKCRCGGGAARTGGVRHLPER